VLANDVTIRKVHIKTGDYYPIRYFDNDNTGLVVEDSEIEGTSGNVTSSIAFAHCTARRLDIHGGADGLRRTKTSSSRAATSTTCRTDPASTTTGFSRPGERA
jgi:hypothetical protein